MRRRARHRLIGASVLVVVGVVGFPLLFDTQPRPVSVDIAVDIPDRASAKPLVDTSTPKPLSASAGLDAKEEVVDTKAEAKSEAKAEAKAEIKPEAAVAGAAGAAAVAAVVPKADAKPEPVKAEVKAEVKTDAKAEAKADTKVDAKAAKPTDSKDAGRFVVQAGTFSDEAKLRETRSKLEKAGISTYTQVIEGKDGRRVRVRVGPFSSRDEADKVARKIKQLSLQPQVLTL
jgi:DedD protein